MDPLSITASSVAILGVITASGKGVKRLLALRKAPLEVLALSNEVEALRAVLLVVQESLLQIHGSSTYLANQEALRILLSAVHGNVTDLESKIEYEIKHSGDLGSNGLPRVSRTTWFKDAAEIEQLRIRIRDSRSNLIAALMSVNIQIGDAIRRTATQVQSISVSTHHHQSPNPSRERCPSIAIDQEHSEREKTLPQSASSDIPAEAEQPNTALLQPGHADEILCSAFEKQLFLSDDFSRPDVVNVTSTIRIRRCQRVCRCRCHISSNVRTPEWMQRAIGQLLLGYTNLIWTKPCNYPPCQRSPGQAHLTFMFPRWLTSRAIAVSYILDNITTSSARWAVKVPVVAPSTSRIWGAVRKGNISLIKTLFSQGTANPYVIDKEGLNLLHVAAKRKQPQVYNFLLEQGADEDWEDLGRQTPPQLALQVNTAGLLHYDVENVAESSSFTSLHSEIVLYPENINRLKQLLESESYHVNTCDKFGKTPLHWASARGNQQAVELLLKWKAWKDPLNGLGRSPLHEACTGGDPGSVETLLKAGCKVNLPDKKGRSPAFYVRESAKAHQVMDHLIHYGANVNQTDRTGNTPLHWAAVSGRATALRLLLRHGANMNKPNDVGSLPVHQAVLNNRLESLVHLAEVSHRPQTNFKWTVRRGNMSILHIAALYATAPVMETLASFNLVGLDPTAEDARGRSPDICFHHDRPNVCTDVRDTLDVEARAWQTLIESVCRQNGLDVSALGYRRHGDGDEMEFFDASETWGE